MPPTGKTVLTGLVTRSQARKHTGKATGVLAYEIDGDNLSEDSETIQAKEMMNLTIITLPSVRSQLTNNKLMMHSLSKSLLN